MRVPETIDAFLELGVKSGLLEAKAFEDYRQTSMASASLDSPKALAEALVKGGLLTQFQADSLLVGKWRGFVISEKYRLLQKLGSGGMGSVYLCEHVRMRRRVALKVLPLAMAEDRAAVERFYLEARAVAALDHPNIIRAYDVDADGKLHFIVLEFVDGNNLHDIIRKHGPLTPLRAAHYVRQAAEGLQHAHEAGVIHRDIKPGNLLLDRGGVIKLLDMGLARFFHEQMDPLLHKQEVGNTLGTAEYVAPEQVDDSLVDIRADIYSLGATFYYLLTGHSPFPKAETTQQKLTWAQVRRPKPVRQIRPEIPEELEQILDKMMAKEIAGRYQTPAEIVAALVPWTQAAIAPPSEEEMPPRVPSDRSAGTPPLSRPSQTPGIARVVAAMPRSSPPNSASAVVTLKVPGSRKTEADPKGPPVKSPPKTASPSAPGGPEIREPAAGSEAQRPATPPLPDLIAEEDLQPAPKAVTSSPRILRKPPPPKPAHTPPAKPSSPQPSKRASKPPPAQSLPTQDTDAVSQRFAQKVLVIGISVFTLGLLVLLAWLLNS